LSKEEKILSDLFKDGAAKEKAWSKFLRLYSNLILKVIWVYARDYDEAMNKYLFVCSKLIEDDFKILRKYDDSKLKKKPTFVSWLSVVVRNLSIDEYRTKNKRLRVPEAIKLLGAEDVRVFKAFYFEHLTPYEISMKLKLQISEVNSSLERIENAGNSRMRFSRYSKVKKEKYNDELLINGNNSFYDELLRSETKEKLNKLLLNLSEMHRVVLKLKYFAGLSAKEISNSLNIPQRKVYSIIEANLKNLKKKIFSEGW